MKNKGPSSTGKSFDQKIIHNSGKGKIKFKGICLKQESVFFTHANIINLYNFYELDTCSRDLSPDFTLEFTYLER